MSDDTTGRRREPHGVRMTDNQVPLWVAIVLAVGAPALAFGGALTGQIFSRRAANEQDVRWHREESMRILRWAAELAAEPQGSRSAVGVASLEALERSELLQAADQVLISAVLIAVVEPVTEHYTEGDIVEEVD